MTLSGEAAAEREPVEVLVENHREFLAFLERRVGSREVAEDLLQEAFVRSLDKVPLDANESAVAWFYRVLRNAVIDHYRQAHPFTEIVPASAEDGTNVEVLERLFLQYLPDGEPLYPPPQLLGRYRSDAYGDFLLAPGRLERTKRPELALRALARDVMRIRETGEVASVKLSTGIIPCAADPTSSPPARVRRTSHLRARGACAG